MDPLQERGEGPLLPLAQALLQAANPLLVLGGVFRRFPLLEVLCRYFYLLRFSIVPELRKSLLLPLQLQEFSAELRRVVRHPLQLLLVRCELSCVALAQALQRHVRGALVVRHVPIPRRTELEELLLLRMLNLSHLVVLRLQNQLSLSCGFLTLQLFKLAPRFLRLDVFSVSLALLAILI